MKTRRDFLKTTATVAVGSMIIPSLYSFMEMKSPYGLILYTVRNEMKKNPIKTLNSVASIGYKVLEAAGYKDGLFYNMKPANYNKFGEIFKKNGVRFAYHNHAYEFKKIDNIIPYDILLQGTQADLVAMEMDLYWITYGGHNPWEYFAKYPGRFELWHVKDMKDKVKKEMTTVGNGIIDFKKIFSLSKESGLKYYFVEQDTALEHPPLENIKISLDYIKKMNF